MGGAGVAVPYDRQGRNETHVVGAWYDSKLFAIGLFGFCINCSVFEGWVKQINTACLTSCEKCCGNVFTKRKLLLCLRLPVIKFCGCSLVSVSQAD